MRKLSELHPVLAGYTRPNSGEQLMFDCPVCPPSAQHRLGAVFSNPVDGREAWPHHANVWARQGLSFEPSAKDRLSLWPSIHYPEHWHGYIWAGWVFELSECVPNGETREGHPVVVPPPVTPEGIPLKIAKCAQCATQMFTDGLVKLCERCQPPSRIIAPTGIIRSR